MTNITLGKKGEQYALNHLVQGGFVILETNFRAGRWGEIDIIAVEGRTLVFVEVKTRTSTKYGEPAEAVTAKKIRHLHKAAYIYQNQHPTAPTLLRLDVIAIVLDQATLALLSLAHFRNVSV